jgi:hypothetical protein
MKPFAIPVLAAALAAASGCSTVGLGPTAPPSDQADACAIFRERPSWWRAVARTEERWGTPPGLVLAIIRQESSFTHDARPPREDGFLFFPGRRPSSAFGYAQALDATWDEYRRTADERGAERDEFRDAADFIGWYTSRSHQRLGLAWTDGRAQYLAYHEGHGGYSRGTYRSKPWLMDVAARVGANAAAYQRQIDGCERDLNGGGFWFF